MIIIIETNASNWTGETVKVRINQSKKTFNLYGYDFKIKFHKDCTKDTEFPCKMYHVIDMENTEYPIGIIVHDFPSKYQTESFKCFHQSISESNLSRNGKTIYEAAIKMLCNII